MDNVQSALLNAVDNHISRQRTRQAAAAARVWPRPLPLVAASKYDQARIDKAAAKRARRAKRNMALLGLPQAAAAPAVPVMSMEDKCQRIIWMLANVRDKSQWTVADNEMKVETHAARRGKKWNGSVPADAANYKITTKWRQRGDELWLTKPGQWPEELREYMNSISPVSSFTEVMAGIVDWVKKNPGK